ncbi:TrkA C-terminal domain-containing protein [Streptomyces sp. NPDC057674]|uniref:aspartate-alanine antiporter-like transporter n=1 Tax=Streptomyces sp. NPDC057674 TaxID=3346203 RepID=UPI00368EBE64
MWQFFADYPWFTLFIVIAAGSLFGMVRFGPVKLGPAGVLFVGLLLGALDPDIGPAVPAGLSVLGLALYVYTVGLEAGPAFFRELRPQLAVMTGAVAALVVTAVAAGIAALGTQAATHLLDRRDIVDYRRILLTNPDLAGHTVAELGLGDRYGAKATRVRRGDQDLLAHDDLLLQLDDRVRVAMPRERTAEVTGFLGDTEAKVSEVSAVSMGLGLAAGFLIGIPKLTIGSTVLSLGTAAGPLVMAMVLGRLRRTGPLVWVLPTRANLTLRQIGLLIFLACVGLTSGYAFRREAFSLFGLKLLAVLVIGAVLSYALMVLVARLLGQSRPRTMGLLAGYVGNPAITAYANSRVSDSRVNTGYATLFALAILVKIVCIQLIVGL